MNLSGTQHVALPKMALASAGILTAAIYATVGAQPAEVSRTAAVTVDDLPR
jgi:hypothetical protein